MGKILPLLSVIIFSFTLYVNYLAGTGFINNLTTGEVSERFPTLFTPAGFTFAIWGVIYLLNLLFVLFQCYKAFRQPHKLDITLNGLFILVCLTNAVWIFVWHQLNPGLSFILILVILSLLIGCYHRVRQSEIGSGNYFLEYINFSVYLSWISVATIANAAAYLTTAGLPQDGFMAALLTLGAIAVAAFLAGYLIIAQGNIWYGLVTMWAAYGILIARSTEDLPGAEMTAIAAFIAVVVIFLSIIFVTIRKKVSGTDRILVKRKKNDG